VHLTGQRLHELPVRAGQFFLWRFLDGPGWSRAHPYSLSAAPRVDALRITVKSLGDGSTRVAGLRPGTRVLVEGPYGAVTADRGQGGKSLLITAGVGITALRGLLDELPGGVTLLHRVRDRREVVFSRELDWYAANRGLRLFLLEGPRGPGWLPAHMSAVDDATALRRMVPDLLTHDVFVCGPPAWMDAVRESLRTCGVPPDRIHTERFAW
jgi:ferredoxin-NADP reductase